MKLKFLGGVNEVGRLGMLLENENTRFILDYGIAPARPPLFPEKAPPVDIAFLTHAHVDHSGMIPYLSRHYDPPVVATVATAAISGLLTRDTLKVAESEGYVQPYSKRDITLMEDAFDIIDYSDTRDEGGFEIHFHSAGHIPGATMFEFIGDENLLFTGDINTTNTRLVWGTHPVKCDTLVMESTYSGRDHPDRREMEKGFLDSVEDVINRGGKVIVPAFAVGRCQEILLLLRDTPYEIWFDGMGKQVTKDYLDVSEFIRRPKELRQAFRKANVVHSYYGRKHALHGDVIVTTSGMLDGGPVLFYLEQLKRDTKSAVFLTGYQVEGTNGRLLLEHGTVNINGVKEKVTAEVKSFDFSAHAGHSELRAFANKCSPSRIILFHSDNREPLALDLREDGFEVILPDTGEEIPL